MRRHDFAGEGDMASVDRGNSLSPECAAPVRRAIMKQGWYDLAYIHFRYDASEVAALLPPQLDVDVHDGSAWVGLVPFSMRGIGLPHLPSVPYLGSFPEINVRTYVVHHGVPGVWFFSLDINRLLPTVVARTTYKLPYCWGSASHKRIGDRVTTRVQRRWPAPRAHTKIDLRIGEAITTQSPLEIFLTARWGVYSRGSGDSLRYAPVQHPQWPLQRAELLALDDSLITAAGFSAPTGDPHVMFSSGVQVRVGLPHRLKDS